MEDVMYSVPTVVIAASLFVSMAIMVEIGYRIGRRNQRDVSDPLKGHVKAIEGAMLAILGLLLAFTFSLSLQRYDGRSDAVVKEANAIGTAYLRSQLLPGPARESAAAGLRAYTDLRVEASRLALTQGEQRNAALDQSNRQFDELWAAGVAAAREDPNPVTTGLYLQALNDVIDSFGERNAILGRHVPGIILLLLYGTFLMTGLLVGASSGLSGHRASFATYILVGLVVLLVFVIIDLDRPRRGLVQVDQQPMLNLQAAMNPPR